MSLLNLAVLTTVAKVDDQADDEPHHKTYPRSSLQAVHHVSRNHDTRDRREWNPGCDKSALNLGAPSAQDPYACADDDEREQGADRYHLSKHVYGSQGSRQGNTDS